MPALTVEGLILKRSNFGEADRMLTILTKNLGKISVVARGVRKITSRRAGNVELLNIVKVGLFKGKGYTLTEAQSIKTFPRIKSNLAVSTSAFHILELVNKILPEDDPNPRVFDLMKSVLEEFENNPRQIILRGFEIKLLKATGFWSLNKMKGLDEKTMDLLERIENTDVSKLSEFEITKNEAIAIERILRYYLEGVLEGKLKSVDVMNQLRKKLSHSE